MTSDGVFSHDNVKTWTAKFEILQQYDLMIIPINIPARDHWVLAVIDFKRKQTAIYDSIETDIIRPAHPEIHVHLLAWLTWHGNNKFGTFPLTQRTGKRDGVNRHRNKATKKA
jgi:hypothetical protein